MKRKLVIFGTIFALLMGAGGIAFANVQQQEQGITEYVGKKLIKAEPYPSHLMNDSSERANVRERLLRMNNPHKIGYVYILGVNGQIVAFYTIKGKVSSTQSELTQTNNIEQQGYCPAQYDNGQAKCQPTSVDSMGDDGTYGPEEGGAGGIFFFTTSGVMIETDQQFIYSDTPLNLTTPPILTINANAVPSSTAGQLKG